MSSLSRDESFYRTKVEMKLSEVTRLLKFHLDLEVPTEGNLESCQASLDAVKEILTKVETPFFDRIKDITDDKERSAATKEFQAWLAIHQDRYLKFSVIVEDLTECVKYKK